MPDISSEMTLLLSKSNEGDTNARGELFTVIYEELYRLALYHGRDTGETLRPTALVNEAYIKLMGSQANFENRQHFFASAALALRQVILKQAERAKTQKRGGGWKKLGLEDWDGKVTSDSYIVKLNEALENLEKVNKRMAEIVSLHYFAGFKQGEIAQALGLTERTVSRQLRAAKAWLQVELNTDENLEETPTHQSHS